GRAGGRRLDQAPSPMSGDPFQSIDKARNGSSPPRDARGRGTAGPGERPSPYPGARAPGTIRRPRSGRSFHDARRAILTDLDVDGVGAARDVDLQARLLGHAEFLGDDIAVDSAAAVGERVPRSRGRVRALGFLRGAAGLLGALGPALE